jgi:hypothetical protein
MYRAVPISTAVSVTPEGTLWRRDMIASANRRYDMTGPHMHDMRVVLSARLCAARKFSLTADTVRSPRWLTDPLVIHLCRPAERRIFRSLLAGSQGQTSADYPLACSCLPWCGRCQRVAR